MKNAVVYARYSSDKQNEQSIEGQMRVCEDYAKRNDLQIVGTYIDRAQSGTNDNRQSFQAMLSDSEKKQWEYIIVYKLDRFSRNKYEMAIHRKHLRDNGIKILSAMENIPDSPEGIILESLLEGMAEYYSAELSQKVKRGNRENRLKGLYTGGPVPLGYYVKDKKVYPDEKRVPIIQKVFEDYLADRSFVEIGKYLDAAGMLTEAGKKFTSSTIYNMIHNEKYIGITRYGDDVYTNIFPQIIPTHIYQAAQEKAALNRYGKQPLDKANMYLLRTKAYCGLCGQHMISESGGKNGTIKRYYKCSLQKRLHSCSNIVLQKEKFEKIIVDITFKIFEDTDDYKEIIDKIYKLHQQRVTSNGLLNILMNQKELMQTSIKNLLQYAEKGLATEETNLRIVELQNKIEEIDIQIEDIVSKTTMTITKDDIAKFLRTVLKKESFTLLNLLINKVTIYPNKVEIIYNYVEANLREKKEYTPVPVLKEHYDYIKSETRIRTSPTVIDLEVTGCI